MGKLPAHVWSEVKSLPIEQVVETRIPLKKVGRLLKGECFLHTDRSKDSLIIDPSKNIWHCFVDDEGGDCIDFISKFDNIPVNIAAIRLANEFGLLAPDEYEKYQKDIKAPRVEKKKTVKKILKTSSLATLADISLRDKVYRSFIKNAGLSKEDREMLLKRGVPEKALKDFFTMPENFVKVIVEIKKDLKISSFEGIPGFYFNTNTKKWDIFTLQGVGFAISNEKGQIEALQIRRTKIRKNESRYLWFASSFADDESKGQIKGCSSGAPLDIIYPEISNGKISITEGKFKALTLTKKGYTVISVQGISNWEKAVLQAETMLSRGKYKDEVLICFDADFVSNKAVKETILKTGNALKDKNISSTVAVWDECYGKGIDDMCLAGYFNKALMYYPFESFEKIDNTIKKMSLSDIKKQSIYDISEFEKFKTDEEKWQAAMLKTELLGLVY